MQLIKAIKQIVRYSNNSKSVIGKFILDNQKDLNKYTVEQIAAQTYTSKASVVRFAQALDFETWREFVNQFLEEVHYQENRLNDVDANYPFKASDSTDEIVDQMKDLHVQSIIDTVTLLKETELKRAVEFFKTSQKIVILAANPNNYLAKTFQRKMLSIGRQVEIASNGEIGLMAGSLGKNDCALIISYSGSNNSPAVEHTRLLKLAHVPIIAITSDSDNYLSSQADVVLKISSRERMYTKIENFATEISIIYILNLLFSLYFQTDYDTYKNYRLNSAKILENNRDNKYLEN
jgi:Transcriptional regulators